MDSLKEARQKINIIDREMAKLFSERMECAKIIADYKKERGLAIYDKAREDEVIKTNSEYVSDPVMREYYVQFLKNTMAVSRDFQSRLMAGARVAYSGTRGAFAHIAATKCFPNSERIAYPDFAAAYAAVENGECDVAVLPIENSYNGDVGQVCDLLFSGSLYVNAVTELAVTHDLVCLPDADISDIKEVISHPQAIAQCSNFIREHNFIAREYVNTALAAEYVKNCNDKSIAAIASAEAAQIFGLKVIAREINTSKTNTTKFVILSRAESRHSSSEMGVHTMLLFTVRNEAGALAKAIDIIGKHGFNMRTLRSRPMKELLWQYYFYVEAEGNVHTYEGATMMAELDKYCDSLKNVGTYTKKLIGE
ncbi:MAG: chorismate mutase [Clostridia bacterium]|nr:chorismate mutase [Clostridia bacterium]